MKFVMLDLETLGNGNNAVIIQISAIVFNPITQETFNEFNVTINPDTSLKYGMEIDISTIEWWIEKSDTYKNIKKNRVSIEEALDKFSNFYKSYANNCDVCGNGVAFDNVILRNAYRKTGKKCPWHYRNDFDLRTLRKLYGKDIEIAEGARGEAHNAIDDCKYQIAWTSPMIKEIVERNS